MEEHHQSHGVKRTWLQRRIHRMRRALKRKRWILPCLVLVSLVLSAAAYFLFRAEETIQLTSGRQYNAGSGYRNITYQGKNYRYNGRITNILYAGVDSDEPLVENGKFAMAPRADSISLIVLDELHHKMTIIALNRDTMTEIRRYSLSGKKSGMYTDHLGYAYTYGDGGKISCDDLCEAVTKLLYGVPIDEYVISNRASLPAMSGIVGPVEVTVPNSDLESLDTRYAKGAKVTITAENLEAFVRTRDTAEDLSNVGRMERQQAYINAAVDSVRGLILDNPNALWTKLQLVEGNLQTNITRSRYLDLARILKNTQYDNRDYYIPEGNQVVGKLHDEFYPDEAALLKKVIDIFYIEQ